MERGAPAEMSMGTDGLAWWPVAAALSCKRDAAGEALIDATGSAAADGDMAMKRF